MKKGQAASLMTIATVVLVFLLAGMAAIYSLDILEDSREDFCDYSYGELSDSCVNCNATLVFNDSDFECHNTSDGASEAATKYIVQDTSFNSTTSGMDGVALIPDKMPTLGSVVIAAIIIGVLLAAFGGFVALRNR